jgi:hypothetical protein
MAAGLADVDGPARVDAERLRGVRAAMGRGGDGSGLGLPLAGSSIDNRCRR